MPEADWNTTARYGRIQPRPGAPTDAEQAELDRLRIRHDELVNMDEEDWTDALVAEAEGIEARLDEIEGAVKARASFRREDFAIAGAIVTVGRDGALQVIQGLVKPEDMPKQTGEDARTNGHDAGGDPTAGTGQIAGSAPGPETGSGIAPPLASPPDPKASARAEAGVGIGLADDLRAIRTALVKAHLANDFEAAFDLMVFQLVRAVFAHGYTGSWHALDIAVDETADRPTARANDETFAACSPGEAMLADWSHLPLAWMEGDDDAACFAALRALSRSDKEALFAAAVARTVKGQLAFEHGARPELEATIARLDIDFAGQVRPTADVLWSRLNKDRILAIARETLGPAWASARSKYRKADLAKAMEQAFAAGDPPVGLAASQHAAALAWTMPGSAPFDAAPGSGSGPADADEPTAAARAAAASEAAGAPAPVSGDAPAPEGPADGNGHAGPVHVTDEAGPEPGNGEDGGEAGPVDPSPAAAIDAMNAVPTADGGPRVIVQTVNGGDAGDDALEVPAFLRRAH